ncbi:hypothetical protein BTH42_08170 [Burkholderia sp. SRS-W-2-2016]|uniref:CPBP family glutamic-type intramembrane protease n=1 Tax=Burkholderia sp. SRS-W-2-2016 TaxID=1926878 RepID=UPI00094B5638|nr:CPBP family glutamic-type intramembrane protease [Burkholderia sp. SRS-W-2-2016]OLL32404.1 hypothetical protein BTH42_08170 [Burkholderia sp. SRS-W-2-2016]
MPALSVLTKRSWSDVPRPALIIGGAAVMFFGQIVLVLAEYALLGAPPAHDKPLAHQSLQVRVLVIVVVMPFVETLIGQWLPIRLINRVCRLSWRVAGFGSIALFTLLHGYTDRAVAPILLGAVVLATVFIVEAKRNGRPVVTTWLTHALANACVLLLQSL